MRLRFIGLDALAIEACRTDCDSTASIFAHFYWLLNFQGLCSSYSQNAVLLAPRLCVGNPTFLSKILILHGSFGMALTLREREIYKEVEEFEEGTVMEIYREVTRIEKLVHPTRPLLCKC